MMLIIERPSGMPTYSQRIGHPVRLFTQAIVPE